MAVGGWWRLAAVGGRRLVGVGGWQRLAVGGGWRLVAVGGWRLAVGGWWSLGAVLNMNGKKWGFLRTPLRIRGPTETKKHLQFQPRGRAS